MRRIAGLRRKHQFGVAGHLDPALAVAVVVQADAAHLGIAVSGHQHFGNGLDVAVATADARATGFEPDPVFVRRAADRGAEARREGNEWVSTCISRWSPDLQKQTKTIR